MLGVVVSCRSVSPVSSKRRCSTGKGGVTDFEVTRLPMESCVVRRCFTLGRRFLSDNSNRQIVMQCLAAVRQVSVQLRMKRGLETGCPLRARVTRSVSQSREEQAPAQPIPSASLWKFQLLPENCSFVYPNFMHSLKCQTYRLCIVTRLS